MMKDEEMQSIVAEAKKNRFATVPKLGDEELSFVWDSVAGFISKNMAMQKGVAIPTLGNFTFTQRKLDIGNNKFILLQKPVFQLSEKFVMTHALQSTKPPTNGQVSVVPLNFAAIAHEINFDRDVVEGCVKEMIQALSRSVQTRNTVQFVFNGIGKLMIKDLKVKMKFYKDFLQMIDGSGALLDAMRNRPGTSDSVLSRTDTPLGRPSTSGSTIILPRINPGNDLDENNNDRKFLKKCGSMTVIDEEHDPDENDPSERNIIEFIPSNEKLVKKPESLEKLKAKVPSKENLDVGQTSPTRLKTAPEKTSRAPSNVEEPVQHDVTFDMSNLERVKLGTASKATPRSLKSSPKPAFDDEDKDTNAFAETKKALGHRRMKVLDKTCSNCLHDAGQELCYLCYQRDRRNVPVYLHEERKKKEKDEDRLLVKYQHVKDCEAILKDQAAMAANRQESQKVAAFNLGVGEAIKAKKAERPTEFQRSFVLHKRTVSPPFYLSQNQYHVDLADQVKKRSMNFMKSKKEQEFLERLEQVHLADELAAQREQYLRNKKLQSEEYKRSLDTQMRYRPLPPPGAFQEPDGPYFGTNDMNSEKMMEKRKQARRLYEDQLNAAAEKKRNAILNDLKMQREETLMLNRAKKDLLDETLNRHSERVKLRRDLEDTWLQSSKTKHSREQEEQRRAQSPGELLHEQCDKYRRCKCCKRQMPNSGESHVWCESRYISGSRIIV
eukprot:Seg2317.3 transcript_id=Seg2317.3/GoldUCD/mRNA.D3Y31 product="Coiled-coil domain-containing protein 81" protein_id=Seg2317.3/GoldUCD/D3Y31